MSGIRKFFVVGTARSGTTLLQAMLMSSPGVYIPPETQYLGMLWRHRAIYGDLRRDETWRMAINRIERMSEVREITLDLDRLRRALGVCERTHASLFNVWLEEIAMSEGVTCIGEKSPVHARYVRELLSMFPDACVIHIVRDPRDVATSQRELWGRNAFHAAIGWRLDAQSAIRFGQLLNADRYSVVRYEDMVTDPESVLRTTCGHLRIDYDERMLEPHKRDKRGFEDDMEHLQRTLEPVTSTRIGRWADSMGATDVAVIELLCHEAMRRFGYEVRGPRRALGLLGACYQAPLGAIRWALARRASRRRERELRQDPAPGGAPSRATAE